MKRILASFTFILVFFFSANTQTIIHSEDFNTNTSGTWTAVDIASPTDIWRFTSGYAQINGFGDENDEDWLISPAINMDNSTSETFTFKTKNRYAGATTGTYPNINLELKYTTNYTGDPLTTTWVNITMPASLASSNNTTSTLSAQTTHAPFDVSSISGTNVRFAFRYYGLATASKEWQVDDIVIVGTTACIAPTTQASTLSGTPSSTTAGISWMKGDGTKTLILINNTNSFTPPVDGTSYTANATYSGSGQQVIYVNNSMSMSLSGLTASTVYYLQAYNMSDCSSPVVYVTTNPSEYSFATTSGAGGGGEPTGYYNAAAGLTCSAKKTALQNIITSGYISQSYSALWTAYYTTDARLNDAGTKTIVYDMYTDNPNGSECEFTFGTDQDNGTLGTSECQKYNREHSFPKSWFGGSTSTGTPGTDLFHVIPTDKKVNGVRGNQPYGETNSPSFTSANGSKYGPSSSGSGGDIFEPIGAYKGDFARIYFYMATRYGSQINGWANTTAESAIVISPSSWASYNTAFLKLLLKWHYNDPVSPKEIARNNAVYTIQGNRNPYVDHPEYIDEIWTNACGLTIPVTLKAFQGNYTKQNVHLDWAVENEYAFNYYEIERSTDGINFTTINKVKAEGLSKYAMDDATFDVKSTRLYYQLKMVNLDYTYVYSPVIAVQLPKQSKGLVVYPNPATKEISFKTTDGEATDFELIITDAMGKIWLQKNLSTDSNTSKSLNISQLSAGNYFITTQIKGVLEHQRLTVVK